MFAFSQPLFGALDEILVTFVGGQSTKFRSIQANSRSSCKNSFTDQNNLLNLSESSILPSTEKLAKEIAYFIGHEVSPVVFMSQSTKHPTVLTLKSRDTVIRMHQTGLITVQKRGFRSKSFLKRQAEQQMKTESTVVNLLGLSTFKNTWSKFIGDKNSAIGQLLENSSAQTKDKVKVAFAEGYEAGKIMRRKSFFRPFSIFALSLFLTYQIYKLFGGNIRLANVVSHNQITPEEVSATFNDVKGIDEAKEEVMKIVDYLRDPNKYTKLGARLPKGVLLVGPPGCGKTLLAKAIAGEAKVPFFRTSGSEFEEMLVGLGAKRMRDLFTAARSQAPCVIFIDEIDSVGSKRSHSALHPYANQTINQLLNEMDGFLSSSGVIVLAATNRRSDLDPALMRPGRFDVEIKVSFPDLAGRIEVFQYYLDKIKRASDVDTEKLARRTIGYSGADIENMINQAALKAAADNKPSVDMHYLDMAEDLIRMGPAKKALPKDAETNKNTAYHEAGHALVAYFTKDAHPVHKITITPRGESLGHTSFAPEKEMYGSTRAQLLASLDVSMGGRVGEEMLGGAEQVTTGAQGDFRSATQIAEKMVRELGMSDRVGVRFFGPARQSTFGNRLQLADQTAEQIDAEVKRLLAESYERAKGLLKTHAATHKRLAEALLEFETLTADDMKLVIEGQPLDKRIK